MFHPDNAGDCRELGPGRPRLNHRAPERDGCASDRSSLRAATVNGYRLAFGPAGFAARRLARLPEWWRAELLGLAGRSPLAGPAALLSARGPVPSVDAGGSSARCRRRTLAMFDPARC